MVSVVLSYQCVLGTPHNCLTTPVNSDQTGGGTVRAGDASFVLSLTEYLNGQRQVFMHPDGYLLSQHKGAWYFEPITSHTQPTKVSTLLHHINNNLFLLLH